jgi:extracellular matrix regulatory protein A
LSQFKVVNVGFSNFVILSKIVCIVQADSSAGKRLRSEAKTTGNLIDATQGRKTRSLIITDSHHLILSSLRTESLHKRIDTGDNLTPVEEEVLEENDN